MKATGIVRPVDPLGRVVIPVELRRTLNIKTHWKFTLMETSSCSRSMNRHVYSAEMQKTLNTSTERTYAETASTK